MFVTEKSSSLTHLYLDSNKNRVNVLKLLDLKKLEVLDLSSNRLNYLYLELSQELQLLNLSHNQLSHFPLLNADIKIVDLTENNIFDIPSYDYYKKVRNLILQKNRIENFQRYIVSDVLESIDLSYNGLREILSMTFYALPELQKLDLSGN